MDDDIKALREEIAKLRERVAVLESKQHLPAQRLDWQNVRAGSPPNLVGPGSPYSVVG